MHATGILKCYVKYAAKQSSHFVTCHCAWGDATQTLLARKYEEEKNGQHLPNGMNSTMKKKTGLFVCGKLGCLRLSLWIWLSPSCTSSRFSHASCIPAETHHLNRHQQTYTWGNLWSFTRPVQAQRDGEERTIFSFMTLMMTIRKKEIKQKLALRNKSKLEWFSSGLFLFFFRGLQALHLCFKCKTKLKESVYSSAGYGEGDCLVASMSWQLTPVLVVPLFPANECRNENQRPYLNAVISFERSYWHRRRQRAEITGHTAGGEITCREVTVRHGHWPELLRVR